MAKIVQINITHDSGSTGKIVCKINETIERHGDHGFILAGYFGSGVRKSDVYLTDKNSTIWTARKDLLISRITGLNGYRQQFKTKKAIKWLETVHPDIIHIHNIHGDWINLKLLFEYIKKNQIPVVWTIHDCWSFTGRCSHFQACGCNKWKTECNHCPDKKVYPQTYFFDFSKKMYHDKKNTFTSVKKLSLTTPSLWLKGIVEQSYLGSFPVSVINNGIDTDFWKPRTESFFKDLTNKFIILGVAASWSIYKGLDDFIELDRIIDHDKYIIVLVGLNSRQLEILPQTMIGMGATKTQEDLCKIYSQAGCLANFSKQETFGMTTIEAMACGTPVVVYNLTAVPEPVKEGCGIVLQESTSEAAYEAIQSIAQSDFDFGETCRKNALENYDSKVLFEQYYKEYQKILTEGKNE